VVKNHSRKSHAEEIRLFQNNRKPYARQNIFNCAVPGEQFLE
jgi:hypothetical protein